MEGKRLLIVDDEVDIVDLLRDVLTSEGYVVDAAPDAETALRLIHDQIYDVAILDFNLPDMDGVMLHRQIRQKDPDLADRCLFMSGLVQSDTNLGYYAAQGAGFLSKPFDIEDVLAAVRNLAEPSE
jgi:two-component system NtrC family sensor kinase